MSAMQSAHQAGIVARASCQLIKCKNLPEFISCAHRTLNELGCSGFARFQFNKDCRHIKFGASHLRLKSRPWGVGAKTADGTKDSDVAGSLRNAHYTYNSNYVLLIVDVECSSPLDSDILKVNVGVFADALNAWLESSERSHCERVRSMSEKISLVDNLNSFTNCLHQINDQLLETQRHVRDDLVMQLISAFPALGLQSDQESNIINIVNASIEQESQLLGWQVKRNIELRNLIEDTVKTLHSGSAKPEAGDVVTQSAMLIN